MRILMYVKKTIYVKLRHAQLFATAERVASRRHQSLSEVIALALIDWCREHDQEPETNHG
jgi:hypothetical protein